jgi:hypothetical protein
MLNLKKFSYLALTCFSLCACSSFSVFPQAVEGQNDVVSEAPVTKPESSTSDASRKVEELAGSKSEGITISSTDGSLSCTLKNWSLKGIFEGEKMITSQGDFVFETTNKSQDGKEFVLVELLIKDRQGKTLKPFNPFKELQGSLLNLSPPLINGQTREVNWMRKNVTGFHTVELKTCRSLKSSSQYLEVYPELKGYPMP